MKAVDELVEGEEGPVFRGEKATGISSFFFFFFFSLLPVSHLISQFPPNPALNCAFLSSLPVLQHVTQTVVWQTCRQPN